MTSYSNHAYPLQDETRIIIGFAYEIHKHLGKGFLEIVYKDAMEYELNTHSVLYEREKEYKIAYKKITLPHKFHADFVVFNELIVEIKAKEGIAEDHLAQTLNYLKVSGCKVGLILNFGEDTLKIKRLIL